MLRLLSAGVAVTAFGVKLHDIDRQPPSEDADAPSAVDGPGSEADGAVYDYDADDYVSDVDESGKPLPPGDLRRFEPKKQWVELPPPDVPSMPIKLAVMMLSKGGLHGINAPNVWLEWLDNAKASNLPVNLHIHLKDNSTWIDHSAQQMFTKYFLETVDRVATGWGRLVIAERRLLQIALGDETVTHLAVVSDDSIPVKSVRWIYREIEAMQDSRFCTADHKTPPRAEMWWLMRRRDALLFRDNPKLIRGEKEMTADEKVWYYPLKKRLEQWGPKDANIVSSCIMFTDWKTGLDSNHTWSEHLEQCNCPSLQLEKQVGAEKMHPNSYASIGPESFSELLASPFWFARKVLPRAVTSAALEVARESWASDAYM